MFSSHSSLDREADMLQASLSPFVCLRFSLINAKPRVLIQKAPRCLFIKEAINALEMSLSTWIQSTAKLKPVIILLGHWWKRTRQSDVSQHGGDGWGWKPARRLRSECGWGRPGCTQPVPTHQPARWQSTTNIFSWKVTITKKKKSTQKLNQAILFQPIIITDDEGHTN